jgi:hypothetical protein
VFKLLCILLSWATRPLIGAELLVHQRLRLVVAQFIDRDIITEAVLPRFKAVIASAMKLRNSVAVELILFILIFGWRKSCCVKA